MQCAVVWTETMRIKSESVIIPCPRKAGPRAWLIGRRNQYFQFNIDGDIISFLFRIHAASCALKETSGKSFIVAAPQKPFKFLQRQRMSEEITLPGQATCIRQKISLLLGFHAFGDDCQPQILRQRDYGSHDSAVIGIDEDIAHE